MNYYHLNTILEYIAKKEGKIFQVIKSEDYGVEGILSFKIIIPKSFEVVNLEVVQDEYGCYTFIIEDSNGKSALDGPRVLLWNSELYSTKEESQCCICGEGIDNGVLVFENFKSIDEIISERELLLVIEGE